MFNDEGLGAAMGQYAIEKKADEAKSEVARLKERVAALEKHLIGLQSHVIRINDEIFRLKR